MSQKIRNFLASEDFQQMIPHLFQMIHLKIDY